MSFLNSAFPAVVNTTDFDVEMYNRIVDSITDMTAALIGIGDQSGNISLGSSNGVNWPFGASLSWSGGKVQAPYISITTAWTYGTLTAGGNAGATDDITVDTGATLTLGGNLVVHGKIDVFSITCASMTIAQMAAPADPPENGRGVLWCSNGSGVGDVGDIMVRIRHNGVWKYTTLVDFA